MAEFAGCRIQHPILNKHPLSQASYPLRLAVRIRQSAWGVTPRRLTRRPVSLTILAVIKLTPSRCDSRPSIATDVKKLGGHGAGGCPTALTKSVTEGGTDMPSARVRVGGKLR